MAKIGMVTIWFDRGQSEVSRTIRQALVDLGHEVHVFARMGHVYGQPKQEQTGRWGVPNLTTYHAYDIQPAALKIWARARGLDAVVFNEEYDFALPSAMRGLDIKTIHYVDFIRADWAQPLSEHYDQCWSATQRTMDLLQGYGVERRHFIGWAIHPDTPYLGERESEYDFFHNAGWLGINFRKGTDLMLRAFAKLADAGRDYSLLVHAQVPYQALGPIESSAIEGIRGLTWRCETVPPPGLYHLGKVVVQPSRLEGLGLTIHEAIYQGRPVVTTDAPPMNEHVTNPAMLVPVASTRAREDGLSFPETAADVDALADAMRHIRSEWTPLGGREHETRRIFNRYYWDQFVNRIDCGLKTIGIEV